MYTAAGVILRNIIKEAGADILNDIPALQQALIAKKCNETAMYQLLLLLQSSSMSRYIPQVTTGISMIDINNIVTNAQRNTGLSKKTIQSVLSAVFYGLSLPTALESVVIPEENNGQTMADKAIVEWEEYEKPLDEIEKAIGSNDEKTLVEMAPTLEKAMRAGIADAQYLKGICHYNGIGAPKDPALAKRYLTLAADNGCVRASAVLGDIHFAARRYTKAFEYYTVIGAIAISKPRQNNVRVILEQQTVNRKSLLMSGITWALLLVFNILFGSGTFSAGGDMHWVCASFSILLTTLGLAAGVYSLTIRKYDGIKWVIPVMVAVTLLFTLIAL